ncbi:glycoside hydrolase family 35 protein [Schizophyllum commune]
MLFSGEFHPFRLPVPELWVDVLQKFKAAGLNTVSVYWHWGLVSPNADTVRFTEHNDLAKFLDIAKEVGVLVVLRPGPYINAESAGGGIPSWTTNIPDLARTNATGYRDAWYPYISEFASIAAPYQYPDGPVVAIQSENEYYTDEGLGIPGLSAHMQDLQNVFRESGLHQVPTIHNDKNAGGQFAKAGPGKVDLYGWDGYPLGFDCDKPEVWLELSGKTDANHQSLNPAEPLALFEWQGGAFSYWSGPGYDQCYQLINEQFANVFYKDNYAAGTAIQNLYMTYGGTNWGNMHTHTIYSSYDYGAAIAEDRTLTAKYSELKMQGYFLHSSPDYLVAVRIGNGTTTNGTAYSDSPDIFTTHLNSPETDANFYFVRQVTNAKTNDTDFTLRVNTTLEGEITIPKNGTSTLAGRESKILVTNYPFGDSKVEYSTAEVLTWLTLDDTDILVTYALPGQYVEIAVETNSTDTVNVAGSDSISASPANGTVAISGSPNGVSVVSFGNATVFVVDKYTARGFWAPRLNATANSTDVYDQSPDLPAVLVAGPYLVRSAAIEGSTLALTGDLNATTPLQVWAPSSVDTLTWNGEPVEASKSNETSALEASLALPESLGNIELPVLQDLEWVCADSLPELADDYDDSAWTTANKTETARPQQPFSGDNVLYGAEYGYHAGDWVWRGHFSGNATGVELEVQCGYSCAFTAFVNSHFLGSAQGTSHSQQGVDILNQTFTFSADQLRDGDNVLTVIHDSTGMNQDYNIDDEHKSPRGIRGYKLLSSDNSTQFTEWKVAGNIGGEDAPDYVRGPYNEGGWWFERVGAHLPGYDASSWKQSCSPYEGSTSAGVTAYRTTFDLNLPKDADIPLAFDFSLDSENPYRTLIFVNGWQFGRFLSSLGPQESYPIPEGILNHRGTNEILLTLWATSKFNSTGAKFSKLELNPRATLSSSKQTTLDIVTAPDWNELRGNANVF